VSAEIVVWQSEHLIQLKQCRADGKMLLYLDEFWIDSNLTLQKCLQKKGDVKGTITRNGLKRCIIVHIGLENGFLPVGAFLLTKLAQVVITVGK
jgi:hypothetical protein